jgi:hypothetical protein
MGWLTFKLAQHLDFTHHMLALLGAASSSTVATQDNCALRV